MTFSVYQHPLTGGYGCAPYLSYNCYVVTDSMKQPLLGLDSKELSQLAHSVGSPDYRGRQLAEWIYRRQARAFDDMDNLPGELRTRLTANYEVGRSQVIAVQRSSDGTTKLLLEMGDGSRVETVGLPYADRFSCCVSTQVGCAIGCLFCATGRSGYSRNLAAGEIVTQVLEVQTAVEPGSVEKRVDHVTFMGMGEPLMNYDATVKAIRLLNKELGIASRNLTVSTAGYIPGIIRLASEKLQITLAVSLHAPDKVLRDRLVSGMSKWPIAELLEACRQYIADTGRRVTFEYCLLEGLNDSETQARQLAGLLRGMNCHVNLIPFNNISDLNLRASSPSRVMSFRKILLASGIQVTQRLERGSDIDAACGQLRRHQGSGQQG